jgi:hypothetical protein
MDFNVKVQEGPRLWLTFWTNNERCGSVILDQEQASVMLWMLEWHLETDAPGNFIHDEAGGVVFLSEGKGDLFAISAGRVEISMPYKDCGRLRDMVRQAFREVSDDPSKPLHLVGRKARH